MATLMAVGCWWRCGGVQEGGRKPFHSINFVTAHDGFTLYDLAAFNDKHNVANGENNNDGENHNLSWNCGEVRQAKHGASSVGPSIRPLNRGAF